MRLDASRALVLDVLHFSRNIPSFPAEKSVELKAVAEKRAAASPRISWAVLFAKAFALVARELPELRRSYLRWPLPHFYQHAGSVATIAVNRQVADEDRLFWGQLQRPETTPLARLQQQLTWYQRAPVEQVFKRQLWFSRFPGWLRRCIWFHRIHLAPKNRARRLGTFGLSVLASHGVFNRYHPHFLTCSLTYGPLNKSHEMLVTLLCDHRVLDGITAARALCRLEEILHTAIAWELTSMAASDAQPCLTAGNPVQMRTGT
jgi:hypothetical protein